MKLIGLTGGISTGKSAVSKIIKAQGLEVIDADMLAREVVGPGTFGLRALVQVFGTNVVKYGPVFEHDFELNRGALAEKIFNDEAHKIVLERIVHPLIQWRAQQEFQRLRLLGNALVFYDAALIFEKDLVRQFDHIVVVNVPADVQLERLMARDNLTRDVALNRVKNQWPLEKKVAGAHYVIDNSKTLTETKKFVLDFLKALQSPNE